MKLERTKQFVRDAFDNTDGPAGLFYSGGSDSLLLLHLLLDIGVEFSIVCFDHMFTREQRQQVDAIVKESDLRVFSYAPMNAYLMGNGKKVSMVEEYSMLDGGLVPFIRDAVHTPSRCAVTDVEVGPFFYGRAPVGFTLNLFGTRKTDRHYATGKVWKTQAWQKGDCIYFAPLWDWTRKDVREGLKHYEVKMPKLDTGSLPMCLNCLCGEGRVYCPKDEKEINAVNWDPKAMMHLFRTKFDIGDHDGKRNATERKETSTACTSQG